MTIDAIAGGNRDSVDTLATDVWQGVGYSNQGMVASGVVSAVSFTSLELSIIGHVGKRMPPPKT